MDKDAHQSYQIGGLKTQIKFLHAKVRQHNREMTFVIGVILIVSIVLASLVWRG